ncbi:DUF1801 domain-containing protein [Candidatus Gracilibacteria bacterium]|nr:DUF1801 domain-containing protein [Candidatus Gracilibacteria bacterium]
MNTYKNIDDYIAAQPREYQASLEKIRQTIRETAPEAEEYIGYGMPGFKMGGTLVYFALFSKHIGFYPGASGVANFKKELSGYKTSKGAIQFPLDNPIPFDIIKKITEFRVEENREKLWKKK